MQGRQSAFLEGGNPHTSQEQFGTCFTVGHPAWDAKQEAHGCKQGAIQLRPRDDRQTQCLAE